MAPSSLFERPGDDADIGDAGPLDGVHDGGEGTEGNLLVGTKIDDSLGGISTANGFEADWQVVHVDRLVLQKDVLVFVDGDDHALFGELIDGTRFGDRDLDTGLQDGCGEHEDEQQHEDDVDQRSDVDLGERGLGAGLTTATGGEGHGSEGPPAGLFRCRRGRSEHGCILNGIEQFTSEVVHAGAEFSEPGGELVVADHRRDRND